MNVANFKEHQIQLNLPSEQTLKSIKPKLVERRWFFGRFDRSPEAQARDARRLLEDGLRRARTIRRDYSLAKEHGNQVQMDELEGRGQLKIFYRYIQVGYSGDREKLYLYGMHPLQDAEFDQLEANLAIVEGFLGQNTGRPIKVVPRNVQPYEIDRMVNTRVNGLLYPWAYHQIGMNFSGN